LLKGTANNLLHKDFHHVSDFHPTDCMRFKLGLDG